MKWIEKIHDKLIHVRKKTKMKLVISLIFLVIGFALALDSKQDQSGSDKLSIIKRSRFYEDPLPVDKRDIGGGRRSIYDEYSMVDKRSLDVGEFEVHNSIKRGYPIYKPIIRPGRSLNSKSVEDSGKKQTVENKRGWPGAWH